MGAGNTSDIEAAQGFYLVSTVDPRTGTGFNAPFGAILELINENAPPTLFQKQTASSGSPTAWNIIAPQSVMTGATLIANGAAGLVPQPLIADRLNFLRGDGTWAAAGGGSDWLMATTHLTAAQINAMNVLANSVVLIEGVPGKMIVPMALVARYNYGGQAFVASGNFTIGPKDSTTDLMQFGIYYPANIPLQFFIDALADTTNGVSQGSNRLYVDLGVSVFINGGSATGGVGSSVDMDLYYKLLDYP